MPRSPADHLRDVLDGIAAIRTYTQGGRTAFDRNAMLRDAVCARLMQLGQSVKDAQAEGLDLVLLERDIPWRAIAGMRDILAHKYALMDKALVWAVVERDLPKLEEAVSRILEK